MKNVLILLMLLFSITATSAQKKPTIMILPSDNWCTQRYFMSVYENQGSPVKIPNYQQAFQEDVELGLVISKIGELMTDLGYSLKDAEQEIKIISTRSSEDNVTQSKTTGSSLSESPLDILKRKAKADIIIQVGWNIIRLEKGKSVTFTLEAFDAYTSKRIATSTGTGKASTEIIPNMLYDAVKRNIKSFDKQLSTYFDDMIDNGREIILTIKCWDNWDGDLEMEVNGVELLSHIQEWLRKNTIKGEFNLSDATENFAQFEQVRIPISKNGIPLDARSYTSDLQKYLKKEPFGLTAKLMMRGLGEAILVLGEK